MREAPLKRITMGEEFTPFAGKPRYEFNVGTEMFITSCAPVAQEKESALWRRIQIEGMS